MCCRCPHPNRRQTLVLLAGAPLLAACKPQNEGPEDIRWGRETCAICGMIISDPHYAAEIRGGADKHLSKFDDIGDAIIWLEAQDWKDDPTIEFWVRDYDTGTKWLDARKVYYRGGMVTPMDYGFAAVELPASDTVGYNDMRIAVIKHGLTLGCLQGAEYEQYR